MKLICPNNPKHILYVHIAITLESWGYKLESFPCVNTKVHLKNWQYNIVIEALLDEAKKRDMLLRHN
jgi:hypothetical protein